MAPLSPSDSIMLTSLARRSASAVSRFGPSASKRGGKPAGGLSSFRSLSTSSVVGNGLEYSQLLAYMSFGSLLGASLYYMSGQEGGKAKADDEALANTPMPKSPAVLTGLNKGTAYLVGDGILTGKVDEDPLLVPHQVRDCSGTGPNCFPSPAPPKPNQPSTCGETDCARWCSEGRRDRRRRGVCPG